MKRSAKTEAVKPRVQRIQHKNWMRSDYKLSTEIVEEIVNVMLYTDGLWTCLKSCSFPNIVSPWTTARMTPLQARGTEDLRTEDLDIFIYRMAAVANVN